jgi:hypothetical protein
MASLPSFSQFASAYAIFVASIADAYILKVDEATFFADPFVFFTHVGFAFFFSSFANPPFLFALT